MEAVRQGKSLEPTDKNYKTYVDLPTEFSKFYFQHLSEAQRKEFVRLVNAGTVKLAYPGHFYVLPFFMKRITPART